LREKLVKIGARSLPRPHGRGRKVGHTALAICS
jgi:hypothetical protein